MPEDTSIYTEVEAVAQAALVDVRHFFEDPTVVARDKAKMAIQLLGRYTSLRNARVGEGRLLLNIAKAAGLEGSTLLPLFQALSGQAPWAPDGQAVETPGALRAPQETEAGRHA
jgi:hypothetical protein